MRRLWFALLTFLYHIRVVIWDLIYRYQRIDEQPLPLMVCQICGKPRHKEKYCPDVKGLDF